MSLAHKKIQTRTSALIIGGLLLVVAAVYALTWYEIQQVDAPPAVSIPGKPFMDRAERRQTFFETMGALRQYGTWPILDVRLSPDRGNPFIKKPSS